MTGSDTPRHLFWKDNPSSVGSFAEQKQASTKKTSGTPREHHPNGNVPWEADLSHRFILTVERVLLLTGAALLFFYASGLTYRHVSSRQALREFDRALGASRGAPPNGGEHVDVTGWSRRRIKEYEDSFPREGDQPVATLRIDRLHIHVPVFGNTDESSLNRGVGWIAGTAQPGESGNIGIAGHRDGFFRGLKDIVIGDVIEISTRNGKAMYAVDQTEVVDPDDVSVLEPRNRPTLTLVTCYPFYFVGSAPQRFIVQATVRQSVPERPIATEGALVPFVQIYSKEREK